MNWLQAHDAVRSYYRSQVSGGSPPVQFATEHDNEPLTDGAGVATEDRPLAPWVRFTFKLSTGNQAEVGGVSANTHRHYGLAIAQVFTPADTGDADNWAICNYIAQKFRSAIVGGSVRFSTPRSEVVGRSGAYWQINVICPFHFDDIG